MSQVTTTPHFQRLKRLNEVPRKLEPKYRIAELLRMTYGELNVKDGVEALAEAIGIKRKQTVIDWMKIEAGEPTQINHFVMPLVLQFFDMQSESQLFTAAHKELLNQVKA
ncbi:hypothetical protein ACFOW1_09655 [Parasediminibacterium paludis]|uniref:XRE family transcriptional regulator n=1 Tax=Parasediminibacterium paludis TaxID=908966 RepID=A0ABV8PYN8_9BACT